MNLALNLALWEAKQEGIEEMAQALLLVKNGCNTIEALEEKGISKSVAEEALRFAKEIGGWK